MSFWLTSGLLTVFFALWAYSNVLRVSSRLRDAGETVAMIDVLVRSPRVLEDSSQFRFSIRNMRCSFYESSNDPSQSQQGLIDISSFPSSLANCSRTANVLTACKINQVQLSSFNKRLSINCSFFRMYFNRENWVGSTRKQEQVAQSLECKTLFVFFL